MDWTQPPAWEPAQPPPVPPVPDAGSTPGPASSFGGIRRGIATAALAVGLLVVGGTAVVLAADPSGSPAPNATTQPSTGGGGTTQPNGSAPTGRTHNCPNMGGSGSGGSSGSGSSSPSTNGATSSPSSSL
ncbi:MAG TPA: hypothetical protein VNM34_13090 [Verrucomicrobiae bacterium]|nr:hypothetical protein [Verrucomicrobiae bacterium]